MKALAVAVLLVVFIFASVTGWRLYAEPDSFVVGGSYTVHQGQVIRGNLDGLFSQITLEEGAQVEGQIRVVSSVLDVAGKVGGSISLVGSDLIVRETAELAEDPERLGDIPYVILLPRMARTGGAAR